MFLRVFPIKSNPITIFSNVAFMVSSFILPDSLPLSGKGFLSSRLKFPLSFKKADIESCGPPSSENCFSEFVNDNDQFSYPKMFFPPFLKNICPSTKSSERTPNKESFTCFFSESFPVNVTVLRKGSAEGV